MDLHASHTLGIVGEVGAINFNFQLLARATTFSVLPKDPLLNLLRLVVAVLQSLFVCFIVTQKSVWSNLIGHTT